ncbi:MAG: hypothetical protein LBG50_02665, partial [Clostridiales Family XIII bacterium]|nr:hypothetical protein [Clostridiales Family XIII bacterium]
ELGGVFTPPEGNHLVPVGWYIDYDGGNHIRSNGGAGGACGPGVSTYRALTDFSKMDANFDALLQSFADHDNDPASFPEVQNVYIVYEQQNRVTVRHYLYDPSLGAGAATTTKVLADTSAVIVDGGAYNGMPLGLAGMVAVGATSTDGTTVFQNNPTAAGIMAGGSLGDGSGGAVSQITGHGSSKFEFVGAPTASQAQFFTVRIGAVNSDATISYYYEMAGADGIPNSDSITVTARFVDRSGAAVAAAHVLGVRKGRPLAVTNDGSASGNAAHSIVPTPVDAEKPNAKWLFSGEPTADANPPRFGDSDPNPNSHPEKWVVNSTADEQILFYYDYATDGSTPDRDQWVRVYYTAFDGLSGAANVKLKDADTNIALVSKAFEKDAPSFPGYVYAGLFHGIYADGDTGAKPGGLDPDDKRLTLTPSERAGAPTDTWTFVYEPGATFTASVDGIADRVTSRILTLEFSAPVKGLLASELSLEGMGADSGAASFGTPVGLGGNPSDGYATWTVPLSGVAQGGARVSISRNAFSFAPEEGGADEVSLSKGPALVSAAFNGEEDRATTSVLTLSFDKPIADLNTLATASLTASGEGRADIAELSAAAPAVTDTDDPDYGKIWKLIIGGVFRQGSVTVTVSLPAALYTLEPDTASGSAWAERRYLVYHKGSADFVSGAPPLAVGSAGFGYIFASEFTQTVADAGTLSKPGYTLYGWSESDPWAAGGSDTPSRTYFRGERITLDTPWTRKADPNALGGAAPPEGATELFPVWLAPPQPRLNAPVVVAGGSAMLTGRVLRVTHDFTVRLEYRAVGAPGWTVLFDESEYGTLGAGGAQPAWRFFDSDTDAPAWYIPAAALTPGRDYEVRLTATDAEVARNAPYAIDTAVFRVPASGGYGGGGAEIPGIVDNQSGDSRKAIVTIQEGNIVVAAPIALSVGNGERVRFTFTHIADGYYNVVADFDGERVTRGVRVADGIVYEVISGRRIDDSNLLTLVLGRTQSVVQILEGAPPASVDGLPELFGARNIFDAIGNALDGLVNTGGIVELKLMVDYLGGGASGAASRIPAADKSAIVAAAAAKAHTAVEYYDFSLVKTCYDRFGIPAGDPQHITDVGAGRSLVISFRLPSTVSTGALAAVYRVHGTGAGGKPAVQALGLGAENKNAAGEYFEVDGQYVLIHAGKFSTYALATAPVGGTSDYDNDNGDSGGGKSHGKKGGKGGGSGGASGSGGGYSPGTGDSANPILWALLAAASILIAVLAAKRHRRRASAQGGGARARGQGQSTE